MANAKKCDRCGKFYEEKCNPVLRIMQDNDHYPETKIDLCPNCVEELKKWLEKTK